MATLINRNKVQFDTSHGGTFNDTLIDTAVPFIDGTNNNHSQKVTTDATFTFDKTAEDTAKSPATGKKLTVPNTHVNTDVEIGRDEFVHRDTEVDGNAIFHGREVHSDPTDPTSDLLPNVQIDGTTNIDGTLDVTDATHLKDTVEIEKKTTIHYDPNDATKQSLQVDGVANFDEDVYMNKNVYIKGTTYDTKTEDLLVGSDFVTLRDGYNGAMTSTERAGILVNKYNGTNDLGIVARNDGTMTVGKFDTKHVYEKSGSYYEDVKCTIAYTLPAGADLHTIGTRNPDTGVQEYWFTVDDDTEPLATRDEEELMEDDYVTKWDATNKKIVTSATNEGRVVKTEVTSKNNAARIYDLEHGKVDLNFTTSYPVEITKTVPIEYTQVATGLNTFVSNKLVRSEKGVADSFDFSYELTSAVPFYTRSGTDPDYVYTLVTHWKIEEGVYYYSTDNRTNWISFNDPTIFYYQEGNGLPVEYEIEQNPESVIRHFDTAQDFNDELAATLAGQSANPLKDGNVVHIKDQLGIQTDVVGAQEILPVGAIGISNRVERGNYDACTSNALAEAIENMVLPEAGFLQSFPVNSIYTTTSSTAPSIGTTSWKLLGTLNGVVLGGNENIYFYKRLN